MHAHDLQPESSELSDAEVIEAILAGNHDRFAILVRRHNQPVFRACRAVLRNDHDAEDAVQAAWLSAFRALSSFRRDASFRTWMTRIAVNEATSRLRQHQRRLAAFEPQELTMPEVSDPEREVVDKELARLIERELDGLPDGLRTVLVLRDVLELDTQETAECLGIEQENVRVRLHRARQAIAQRLSATATVLDVAMPEVWRFDGERCARMLARVMSAIATER